MADSKAYRSCNHNAKNCTELYRNRAIQAQYCIIWPNECVDHATLSTSPHFIRTWLSTRRNRRQGIAYQNIYYCKHVRNFRVIPKCCQASLFPKVECNNVLAVDEGHVTRPTFLLPWQKLLGDIVDQHQRAMQHETASVSQLKAIQPDDFYQILIWKWLATLRSRQIKRVHIVVATLLTWSCVINNICGGHKFCVHHTQIMFRKNFRNISCVRAVRNTTAALCRDGQCCGTNHVAATMWPRFVTALYCADIAKLTMYIRSGESHIS